MLPFEAPRRIVLDERLCLAATPSVGGRWTCNTSYCWAACRNGTVLARSSYKLASSQSLGQATGTCSRVSTRMHSCSSCRTYPRRMPSFSRCLCLCIGWVLHSPLLECFFSLMLDSQAAILQLASSYCCWRIRRLSGVGSVGVEGRSYHLELFTVGKPFFADPAYPYLFATSQAVVIGVVHRWIASFMVLAASGCIREASIFMLPRTSPAVCFGTERAVFSVAPSPNRGVLGCHRLDGDVGPALPSWVS